MTGPEMYAREFFDGERGDGERVDYRGLLAGTSSAMAATPHAPSR